MATAEEFAQLSIVIVDNDDMILSSLSAVLSAEGFEVNSFQEPRKCLDWLQENRTDIVLSDICMPDLDGFAILHELKRIAPETDLIFITAHSQTETAIRALREGASDFVEKPVSADTLLAAIERTRKYRRVEQQRRILSNQVTSLVQELNTRGAAVMLGQSSAMRAIAEQIVDLAAANATVLILGESGTGKELVAQAIHASSPRKDNPFLVVNCASVPEDIFEAEMFGHRKGAFTGAVNSREGYVAGCEGGTLFLDEIGDLPLKSQAKILRLLEQKSYMRVGENQERSANVRIVAATNQSLKERVQEKAFREDLFYRLSVCTIQLPPLRERKEDIPLLALYYTLKFAEETGKAIEGLADEVYRKLAAYSYPGNIRELRNMMESSVIHCRHGGKLLAEDLPPLQPENPNQDGNEIWPPENINFESVERRLYEEALERANGNVSAAARMLGLSRGKLRRRMAALGIAGEDPEEQTEA